eukprot:TRINITY_DN8723_c0_g2_i2.p1 TRINITY_DN8723_c0_g2~~TRINITY_DN8723_c0_g2_i2.p1  ORF type:complete len:283 (-),score=32.94 TRINITY_DN8723_c0_g2_i2:611-1459(-)
MVSQRAVIFYGLLLGMLIGLLYSAFEVLSQTPIRHTQQVNDMAKRRTWAAASPRRPARVRPRRARAGNEFLIKAGILEADDMPTASVDDLVAAFEHEQDERDRTLLPRVCGSPAVDGYTRVDVPCLLNSPTAKAWHRLHLHGGMSGLGLTCNLEEALSLDGVAVAWGPTNKKATAEECCQSCREHVPGPHLKGPFQALPCNVWVFCPADKCFEVDELEHTQGDCWLKFSEAPQNPEVNARGAFDAAFLKRHPEAPQRTPWVSGALVPVELRLTNGTWGPRAA